MVQTPQDGIRMMTYYFIMYGWRSSLDPAGQLNHGETLSAIHPIQWLVQCRRDSSKEMMPNKKLVKYDYWLLGWKEVSEEIYNQFEDEVG